ncbi:MAG: hypothetical protein QMC21_00725 [Flavobacteriales bacterium]
MNRYGKGSLIAILITLVIHVAALLYFNISTLETKVYVIPNTAILELDFKDPEEIEKIINPEEEIQTPENNQTLKDLMKDIQDIRNQSYEDYSESEIEQKQLEAVEAENKKSVEELREKGIEGFDPSKFETKTTKKDDKKEKTESKKENAFAGKVTKECNVPGRECSTKTPAYICKGGGKVYIEINVDKIGRVKNARVIPSKSTVKSECILNTALKFAKKTTRVSSDLEGSNSQTGYIIYNFISQ